MIDDILTWSEDIYYTKSKISRSLYAMNRLKHMIGKLGRTTVTYNIIWNRWNGPGKPVDNDIPPCVCASDTLINWENITHKYCNMKIDMDLIYMYNKYTSSSENDSFIEVGLMTSVMSDLRPCTISRTMSIVLSPMYFSITSEL